MSTWRFSLPLVLLASLTFACETPVPDDQIQARLAAPHRSADDTKPTAPTKPKPATTPATTTTTTSPTTTNTTPTTSDATPAPAPAPAPATTTTPPPATDPPPAADPPPATQPDLVEVDCCVGTQFVACAVPSGTQCADVDVGTDCDADPTADNLCQ